MILKENINSLKKLYSIIFISIISLYIVSCGADIESASSVEPMFDSPLSLQDKMDVVCAKISSDSNLSLDGLGLGEELCSTTPGEKYINISDITEDSDITSNNGEKKSDSIFSFWTRSELYVNSAILDTIQKASHTLQNLTSADSSDNEFHISMINKLNLDKENISVTATVNVASSASENGQSNISNNWSLYGTKVDNYLVASVQTIESTKADVSVIESAKIFIVIIPHAGEVYIDLLTQFNLHAKGVDAAMKKEIIKMLNKTFYDIKQTLN